MQVIEMVKKMAILGKNFRSNKEDRFNVILDPLPSSLPSLFLYFL